MANEPSIAARLLAFAVLKRHNVNNSLSSIGLDKYNRRSNYWPMLSYKLLINVNLKQDKWSGSEGMKGLREAIKRFLH